MSEEKRPTISDIRDAEEQRRLDMRETATNFGKKALHALGAPQRYAAAKLAEIGGLKPAETSEENFANLADAAGDSLGVPRDSTLGNIVKAGAVAGAEVFADPLIALPLGKLEKATKNLPKLRELAEAATKSGALENAAKIFGGGTVSKMGDIVTAAAKDSEMASKYGKVSMITDKPQKLGSVKVIDDALKTAAQKQQIAINNQKIARAIEGRDVQYITKDSSRATKVHDVLTNSLGNVYKKGAK